MHTIKAVRAHNAALKHKPSADRIPLWYSVSIECASFNADKAGGSYRTLIAGNIQVKAPNNNSRRKAEMTKLMNRLQAMYPEATHFEVSYVK